MSLVKRFSRYFQTNRTHELQMRDLLGIVGRSRASSVIRRCAEAFYATSSSPGPSLRAPVTSIWGESHRWRCFSAALRCFSSTSKWLSAKE